MSIQVGIKYVQARSGATSFDGAWMPIPYDRAVSAATSWTGTLAGTFKLECRFMGGTPSEVPNSSTEFTQPAGVAQSTPIVSNWSDVPGTEYRITWTFTSGAGNITINLTQGDRQESE